MRRPDGMEADGEAANNDQSSDHTTSAAEEPNEPSASRSSASIGDSETMNENSGTNTRSSTNNNDEDDDGVPPIRPRVNAELENLYRARDILHGISNRALSRATQALQRTRALASNVSAETASSPDTSLEQRLEQRLLQRRERTRQRAQRASERRERSRERRSRRRQRAQGSSSENEESAAQRRRRAHNVVASLQDIMLVPTSSTLGESTDAGTPRSNVDADASAANARPNHGNESANDHQGEEFQERGSRSRADNNNNVFRRARERRRQRHEARSGMDSENGENDSDDDSINVMDDLITNGMGFELGSLVDRDRILNNLMQRSITMLRDIEGANSARQRSTDLKCPVCNENFVDYEASDHPNAPGSRSGSTRCSHGAMSLFTKLHQCPICFEENIEAPNVVALACGHVLCKEDFCKLGGHVGADRPLGCPRAKPLPARASSEVDNNSSTSSSENNGSSLNFSLF